MGFIVEPEPGIRVYHYGDTALFSDLKLIRDLYRPTIAILGCANPDELLVQEVGPGKLLTGEMSPDEAALAAEWLGTPVAIASHYYNADQPDVRAFLDAIPRHDSTGKRQVVAPMLGETLVLESVDGAISVRRGQS